MTLLQKGQALYPSAPRRASFHEAHEVSPSKPS